MAKISIQLALVVLAIARVEEDLAIQQILPQARGDTVHLSGQVGAAYQTSPIRVHQVLEQGILDVSITSIRMAAHMHHRQIVSPRRLFGPRKRLSVCSAVGIPSVLLRRIKEYREPGPHASLDKVMGGVSFRDKHAGIFEVLFQNLRSEEHTSELQSLRHLVCRLLLEKKKH